MLSPQLASDPAHGLSQAWPWAFCTSFVKGRLCANAAPQKSSAY